MTLALDVAPSAPLYTDKILMMQTTTSDVSGTIYDITKKQFLPISSTTYGHRHNRILALGPNVIKYLHL